MNVSNALVASAALFLTGCLSGASTSSTANNDLCPKAFLRDGHWSYSNGIVPTEMVAQRIFLAVQGGDLEGKGFGELAKYDPENRGSGRTLVTEDTGDTWIVQSVSQVTPSVEIWNSLMEIDKCSGEILRFYR